MLSLGGVSGTKDYNRVYKIVFYRKEDEVLQENMGLTKGLRIRTQAQM